MHFKENKGNCSKALNTKLVSFCSQVEKSKVKALGHPLHNKQRLKGLFWKPIKKLERLITLSLIGWKKIKNLIKNVSNITE